MKIYLYHCSKCKAVLFYGYIEWLGKKFCGECWEKHKAKLIEAGVWK